MVKSRVTEVIDGAKQPLTPHLLQRETCKFFAYNLSADDGGMFIFTISKKRGSGKQLIKLVTCRQGNVPKPAERKFGKR